MQVSTCICFYLYLDAIPIYANGLFAAYPLHLQVDAIFNPHLATAGRLQRMLITTPNMCAAQWEKLKNTTTAQGSQR
jgi:hypothetical protein